MICNQAPLSLASASDSLTDTSLNLEHFLSQYLPSQETKMQTIQQTLQKAESQGPLAQLKLERALKSDHLAHKTTTEPIEGLSSKTPRTLDTIEQTPMNPQNRVSHAGTLDISTEDNTKKNKSNKLTPTLYKAKTFERQKTIDQANIPRTIRQSAMPTFWSPHRDKSPNSSFGSHSFISDNTSTSQVSQRYNLNIDTGHPSESEDEDKGGFLMIKPLTSETPNHKLQQPPKTKNFNLNLDDTLFPKEIIEYADSLQEENLVAYVRTLIDYMYSFRDQNTYFTAKRPISEALYSIYFEGETLEMFKKLLQQVRDKLKEESITLKQKYRSELEYIETKHSKVLKSSSGSVKFEEKELQNLRTKIGSILQERCLMDSQSILNLIQHFLDKIVEKFPSIYKPNALKLGKNVKIDHITLPKLLECLVDNTNTSSSFYRTLVLYTYDLYTTPQNLLVYLIQRYFEPEPFNMSGSELRTYRNEVLKYTKIHLLRIINFWIDERNGDFMRNSDIIAILNTFLDIVEPIEQDKDVQETLKILIKASEDLNNILLKPKRKSLDKAEQLSSTSPTSLLHPAAKPELSLFNKVVSISDGVYSPQAKDENLSSKATPPKASHFGSVHAPSLQKSDSSGSFHSAKGSEISNKTSSVVSQNNGTKFRFWSSFQAVNKSHYDFKMLLEENNEEIAKNLTVIDWNYFSKINISEMIKKRWTKGDKAECPNYFKYVRRFNSFCSWIQYITMSQESISRRAEIVEKFLEIAIICLQKYNNYCSSHYIFAALSSLEKFGIISLQEPFLAKYEELKKTFIPPDNFLSVYKEIFGALKGPAIPNMNFFLQSFLKLQDGVNFLVKLPESYKYRYLKFSLLVPIHDSCKEMRRFQKATYENIQVHESEPLHRYLKKGFKEGVPLCLENSDEALNKLTKMANQVKEKQNKRFNFFGVKATSRGSGI